MRAERRQNPLRQFIRFGLTGVLSTAIHVAIATVLIEWLSARAAIANTVAFGGAVSISYLLNTRWSFTATATRTVGGRYLLVSLAAAGLCALISGIAERQGLHYLVGIALVVAIVTPMTFVAHRKWTYEKWTIR